MSTYCISDVHGYYNILNDILNYLKPEDILYVIGDCADRGPAGWDCIKRVIDDPRCIYIMGNHEKMLIDTINSYFKDNESREFYDNCTLLSCNGGESTFEDCLCDDNTQKYIDKLNNLPYYTRLVRTDGKKILLTHSGYEIINFEEVNDREKYDCLWDRTEYIGEWPPDDFDYIIHGHTPIQYMIEDLNKIKKFNDEKELMPAWDGAAYIYCKGHKINIDSCTVITNQIILFNIDNFTSLVFKGE